MVAVAVEAVVHEEHRLTMRYASDLVAVGVGGLACGVEVVVVVCALWMTWKMGGKEVGVVADESMPLMTLLPSFCFDADPHHPLPLLGQALHKGQ